jgi:hypothetical protein
MHFHRTPGRRLFGGALAIADFAAYRHPDIPVIAVTAFAMLIRP